MKANQQNSSVNHSNTVLNGTSMVYDHVADTSEKSEMNIVTNPLILFGELLLISILFIAEFILCL